MAKEITLSKVELKSVQIIKNTGGGYTSSVEYSIQNADGSESFTTQSVKYTSETPDSSKPSGESEASDLSVGSDALVMNFVNSITTLMGDREEL